MIRSSPTHPHHRTRTLLAGAATLGVALTACSAGGADQADAAGPSAKAPEISVNLHGKHADAGEPVRVKITDGRLSKVTVRDSEGGGLPGKVSGDGKSWTSGREAAPGTEYSVRAEDDHGASARAGFTTAAPDKVNKLSLVPGNKTTVGVAQPLSVVFDHPVKNRAAVERRLDVTTSNGTEGSWGWMRDYSGKDRVDWRPREYWKPGTEVSLKADLNGVDSGAAGGWFVRDYATHFTVGERQAVKVDLDKHRLRLTRDGRTVKDVPMSAGTPGGDKASWRGTAVLMAKEGTINMRSETVGLGDAYDKMVDSSMRLTWSGMYAHAAPWNKAYFGKANKSSGCVGMSDKDAAWIYRHVHVGDPFEVTGDDAKGTIAANNGYGEWNLSWADWQTKSALGGDPN
ncbi:L,D-transpeptidase [Streptomyces chryseus]|uniref:L,D-transpeptidase n=1 Tax=Streptomyces chryseus TaxID=68186 RepID=UPI00110FC909|nr:putative L,D-transpeptidase LppS [Streptomyces chryseus]